MLTERIMEAVDLPDGGKIFNFATPDRRHQDLEQLHAASLLLEQAFENNQRALAAYDHARRVWQAALDALKD